jgi:hypothetical protein
MTNYPPGQYPQGQPNQQQYSQAYPPAYPAIPPDNPGKGLGIAGLIMGFLGPLSVVGLILSIVGLRKSKQAGMGNGVAVAGIIISAIDLVIGIIATIILISVFSNIFAVCAAQGPGVHFIDGVTYTCG